jgi:hypothetical protein
MDSAKAFVKIEFAGNEFLQLLYHGNLMTDKFPTERKPSARESLKSDLLDLAQDPPRQAYMPKQSGETEQQAVQASQPLYNGGTYLGQRRKNNSGNFTVFPGQKRH